MAHDSVKEPKGDTEDSKSNILWWCFAVILLILGILAGLGINEYQKFHAEKARLGEVLANTKNALSACQVTKVPHCDVEPKVVVKKPHKVHRYAVPKPPVAKARVVEKKFDPRSCGEMDAVINKATGKPECRAISTPVTTFAPAPMPAPVVTKVEAPKTEMKCEKPLIRKLNDDGSIECIALPAPVAQAAPGCLPPDEQGRIFCRTQRVVVSQPVVPIYSGYGYDRHYDYQRPAPRYEQRPYNPSPYWIVPPQQGPSQSPGVTTLPPSSYWIVPPQQRPNSGPGVTTLPPGPGVVTR